MEEQNEKTFVMLSTTLILSGNYLSLTYYVVDIEDTVSKSCPAALGNSEKSYSMDLTERTVSPLESGMAPHGCSTLEICGMSTVQELPR